MTPAVNVSELSPEVRKRLGVKKSRRRAMSLDAVRSHALRVLAVVAQLSQVERSRVLKHAAKLNAV